MEQKRKDLSSLDIETHMMLCAIWYHLYNFKNVKNTHGGALLLLTLKASACNVTKINTPLWLLFTFFKLYKWYQIGQSVTYEEELIGLTVISPSPEI